MAYHTDYRAHTGARADRFYKTTLFQSPRMLVGVDCLEPGQTQPLHLHRGRDKAYLVVEGQGEFTVGAEQFVAGPGTVVWAPADVPHQVVNTGTARMVMVIAMAPEPG